MKHQYLNSSLGSTEEAILRIVGDHLGIPGPTLSLDARIIEDLGADSLDLLELIMTIEELFEIRIPEEHIAGICRLGDIVAAIESVSSDTVETHNMHNPSIHISKKGD